MTSPPERASATRTPGPDASRRSERARRAILSAARGLAREVGYGRMSIEGIAAAAGVGKQTIYRWWPSKAAVLFDAILESNSFESGVVGVPDTGNLESDLRMVLRGAAAELRDPATDRLQRTLTAEVQADRAIADELVRRLLRPQLDATAARIEEGIRAGQVDSSVDPGLAVELIFGPVFHRWALRTGDLDDAFVDGLLALVLTGLRPR
nr:TetR/AcrR family transcriptional regulator [Gordonia shandongensis]